MKDKQNTYRNHSGIGLFITFFYTKRIQPVQEVLRETDWDKKITKTDGFCWVSLSSSGFSVGSSGF